MNRKKSNRKPLLVFSIPKILRKPKYLGLIFLKFLIEGMRTVLAISKTLMGKASAIFFLRRKDQNNLTFPISLVEKRSMDIVKFIFSRCYLLYALIGLVLYFSIDHQKVIFKTLDYLHDPPHYIMSIAKGEVRPFARKLRDGIRYYKNIIKLFPNSATAYSVLGFCYFQLEEYDKAILNYQTSIKLDPDLFGNHYNLGMVYYHHGNYDKAIDTFRRALTIKPDKTITYNNMVDPNRIENNLRTHFIARRIAGLKRGYTQCHKMIALSHQAQTEKGRKSDTYELPGLYYYPPAYIMNVAGKKPITIM